MPIKPETEIRNLKRDLDMLRIFCIDGLGVHPIVAYMPMVAVKNIKKREPRKLNKKQKDWLKERVKEFNKMLKSK